MTALMVTAASALVVAAALVLVRLLIGPSLHDRLVALDTLVVLMVCGVVVRSAHLGEVHALVLLVLVALVGVLSTLTAVRLIPEEEQ
ncbi:monovalent cation/H+ antiporter complex subunit F [Nocardioides sp. TF02-7]|uniref:monovalent cation/H+ antiporter complex subunit F n=1 Tax=Nocardioides sp. TF02-7 TaxID=2917724 RepID=UPI001F05B3F0|nr:monovalent cation/H+ antiporter complex subunit F [Nocardioides sp. TF02-7]UMG91841.1 monovalent cation/H+ antiporter complex subunit F [Nocardioides sp. TF02-7]